MRKVFTFGLLRVDESLVRGEDAADGGAGSPSNGRGCRGPEHAYRVEQAMMEINTSRFGLLRVDAEDQIVFPSGLLGLESCRQWVLLADLENEQLGWLQSLTQPSVALAVVSPRRFVPAFQLRVSRHELEPLHLEDLRAAQVLAVVGKNERSHTLNLKAPLVVNPEKRLGRQVIANGDWPIQYELNPVASLRKSA